MKKLYILIADGGGDGSYHPCFTMDDDMFERMQEAYDNGDVDYEFTPGIDGDGFNYKTLNIPEFQMNALISLSEFQNTSGRQSFTVHLKKMTVAWKVSTRGPGKIPRVTKDRWQQIENTARDKNLYRSFPEIEELSKKIHDPENAHLFSAEAAQKAFKDVEL